MKVYSCLSQAIPAILSFSPVSQKLEQKVMEAGGGGGGW